MNIASFISSIGFSVDQTSLAKVDAVLNHLEQRLLKLGTIDKSIKLALPGFAVDQRKLNIALGNALDVASTRVVFEVSRFHINQTALNRDIHNALTRASASSVVRVGATGGASRNAVVAGATAGGIGLSPMRLLGPALALGMGGYGLSALNKKNQEVVASQLQTQAVVMQGGGTEAEGKESFQWLRSQGNKIGFNYLKASPEYNNLLANMTGAGYSVKQGQDVFKSFAELSRTYKLGTVQQQRVFLALSQIAGKGQLQSQELKLQLGQALPGAEGLFASAYQKMIGGKLTGQESIAALLAAMKKGKVSADILNYVSPLVHDRAVTGGLDKAEKASAAEQGRYQNRISDLAVVASDAGVEEGYARIFRTLTAGLGESNGLVTTLAEGFNEATKEAERLLLFPQSFVRALEGKDSLVADWLGVDKTKQLQEDWRDIKQIFTDISTIKFDFLPTLKSTADEIAKIMNAIAEFQRWKSGDLPTQTTELGDITKIKPFAALGEYTSPVGIYDAVVNNTGVNLSKARDRGQAVYDNPESTFYHKHELYDDVFSRESQKAQAMEMATAQASPVNNTNILDITVKIDPTTLATEDASKLAKYVGDAVKDHVGNMFNNVQDKFPAK